MPITENEPEKQKIARLILQMGTAFAGRLFINTSRRFIYPFAPELSRGLGVPLTAVTSIIAVNQITGILSLVFGPLGDRLGYRALLLAGLGAMSAGMLLAGILPYYWTVLAGLLFAGMAKSMFDPSILAYVGKKVSFERRGLAIGFLEMAWAGSSLVGIPLMGIFMDNLGWRSPFFFLGIIGLFILWTLARVMPKNHQTGALASAPFRIKDVWRRLSQSRPALGALGFAFCMNGANDTLFVVYGVWLEKSFHLSLTALGLATTVIGLAELSGEGMVAGLSDRLGLKQSVLWGVIMSGLSYLVLPFFSKNLGMALGCLFLVFLAVEFTIVCSLSFFTELLPDARATMMAGYLAAASIGRVCGALIGGPAWIMGGMTAVGSAAALITALGLASLLWGVHDWVRETP
jgi:predicted MFS family arabinose efflux permease